MEYLFHIDFKWSIETDSNRVFDALQLRYLYNHRFGKIDKSPASVLEVLIALAKRCEDDVMQDPEFGDCTYLWFWTMIENLGLMDQTDDNFDEEKASEIIYIFLNRRYKRNGKGSIFYTTDPHKDFRKADLWYQTAWYMDEKFMNRF